MALQIVHQHGNQKFLTSWLFIQDFHWQHWGNSISTESLFFNTTFHVIYVDAFLYKTWIMKTVTKHAIAGQDVLNSLGKTIEDKLISWLKENSDTTLRTNRKYSPFIGVSNRPHLVLVGLKEDHSAILLLFSLISFINEQARCFSKKSKNG